MSSKEPSEGNDFLWFIGFALFIGVAVMTAALFEGVPFVKALLLGSVVGTIVAVIYRSISN